MKTNPPAATKLAGFAVVVALVFGATFGVARAVDSDGLADRSTGGHGDSHGGEDSTTMEGMAMDGMEVAKDAGGGRAPTAPPGLAVAEAGYRLVPEATTLSSGSAVPFRFRIDGPDGGPVQRYGQLHERELHLIVVRRDLTGFQHVHPTRASDGTWTVSLDLQDGGAWRAFADFAPTGGPAQLTLGVDLQVPGVFTPGTAPTAAAPADRSLVVSFDRRKGEIEIVVRRDGSIIEPQPYLGALGHLVALRGGDLAYLHVHPQDGGGPAVRFHASLPTTGIYALFFDYKIDGVVRTATTTIEEK